MSTAAQDFITEAKPISQFEIELSQLLNKHSMENSSDTPDYVLAEYLSRCLYAYNNAIQMRKIHSGEIEREKREREDGFLKALDEMIKTTTGQANGQVTSITTGYLRALHFVRDLYLSTQTKKLRMKTANIVCYCGSLRVAMDAFKKAEYDAVLRGEIALLPCCMFVDIQREYGAESNYKIKADELHKRKIDICDEVMVLNVGGYIGESTRSEIEYAKSIGKPIKYLEQ